MSAGNGIELNILSKYRNVIEFVENYCISCELAGIEMSHKIFKEHSRYYTSNGFIGEVYIYVTTKDLVRKDLACEFKVILDFRGNGDIRFDIIVPLESGINIRKVGANLKKYATSWDKNKDFRGIVYRINCKKEKFPDVFNLFVAYLP